MFGANRNLDIRPSPTEEMIAALRCIFIETFGTHSTFSVIVDIPVHGPGQASKHHCLDFARS